MDRPTVIVCVDGLDPRYLDTCDTPNLRRLSRDGFLHDGKCMMPSVTNVNNVSLLTAGYPEDHGICTNYLWDRSRGAGAYMESGEYVRILNETPGVDGALSREEASARFRLPQDRIGDVVVLGDAVTVFGDPNEVKLPPGLRSHGSTHETAIPILGYNGDFSCVSFDTNRDVGRYVFERALG